MNKNEEAKKELWNNIVNFYPAFQGEDGENNKKALFNYILERFSLKQDNPIEWPIKWIHHQQYCEGTEGDCTCGFYERNAMIEACKSAYAQSREK